MKYNLIVVIFLQRLTKEAPSTSYSSGNKIFLGYTGSHYMLFKPQDDFVSNFKSGLPVVHDVRKYLCMYYI